MITMYNIMTQEKQNMFFFKFEVVACMMWYGVDQLLSKEAQ